MDLKNDISKKIEYTLNSKNQLKGVIMNKTGIDSDDIGEYGKIIGDITRPKKSGQINPSDIKLFRSIGYNIDDIYYPSEADLDSLLFTGNTYNEKLENAINKTKEVADNKIKDYDILGKLIFSYNYPDLDETNMVFLNAFTSVKRHPSFDLRNIINAGSLFYKNINLEFGPNVDTSKLVNMSYMFSGCSNLKTVPIYNLNNCKNIAGFFNKCTSLTEVPLMDISNIENMGGVCQNCSSLIKVPDLDYSQVYDLSYAFENCSSLREIKIKHSYKIIHFRNIFNGCTSLETLYIEDLGNINSKNNIVNAFSGCASLKNVSGFNGLRYSISFSDSPLLSVESVKNILENAGRIERNLDTSITLHPDVFSKIGEDVTQLAKDKNWKIITI